MSQAYEEHIPGTLERPPMTLRARQMFDTVPWDLFAGDLIQWGDSVAIVLRVERDRGFLRFTAHRFLPEPCSPVVLTSGDHLPA